MVKTEKANACTPWTSRYCLNNKVVKNFLEFLVLCWFLYWFLSLIFENELLCRDLPNIIPIGQQIFFQDFSSLIFSFLRNSCNLFICLARSLTYSSSYNLAPPISRVLIGQHLIFCSLMSPTCCNLPRKCTPVKYKAKQKAGFPIVT